MAKKKKDVEIIEKDIVEKEKEAPKKKEPEKVKSSYKKPIWFIQSM